MTEIDANELQMKQIQYHSKRAEYARNYYNRMKASDPTFAQQQNDRVRTWALQNKLKNPKLETFGPDKRIGRPPAIPKDKPEPKKRGRPLKVYTIVSAF